METSQTNTSAKHSAGKKSSTAPSESKQSLTTAEPTRSTSGLEQATSVVESMTKLWNLVTIIGDSLGGTNSKRRGTWRVALLVLFILAVTDLIELRTSCTTTFSGEGARSSSTVMTQVCSYNFIVPV